jgi:hypothetical protein
VNCSRDPVTVDGTNTQITTDFTKTTTVAKKKEK